jgi:hypothetical protein
MTNRFHDEHPLMGALAKGLPITLLIDLIDPNGPRSHEMYEREAIGSDERAAAPTTARTA